MLISIVGYSKGGEAYWATGVHIYTPLPLLTNELLRRIKIHSFLTAGNIIECGSTLTCTHIPSLFTPFFPLCLTSSYFHSPSLFLFLLPPSLPLHPFPPSILPSLPPFLPPSPLCMLISKFINSCVSYIILLCIHVHLAGLNFAITSSKIKYFSASELHIIWDLQWCTFYSSVPYQSKDSCMYHKQSMEIIIRALTSDSKVNVNEQ